MNLSGTRVMVTGGAGFLGQRIVDKLERREAIPIVIRFSDYDLTKPEDVRRSLVDARADYIIHAAAVVGGIGANRAHPAKFFFDNAVMGIHLIHEAWRAEVKKMLVVGTVCAYPKHTPMPFREEDIWNGYPEETNAPYGVAKKALLVQSQAYRDEYGFNCVYVIPTNLYGPGDNFDRETSHVVPGMIRKFIDAKEQGNRDVVLWGTGTPSREFLYVDDAAEGIVRALEDYDSPEPLNLGSNSEVGIADLAVMIADATGFSGKIVWDSSQPDGQPRRAIDASKAAHMLGWKTEVELKDGIGKTVDWYVENQGRSEEASASPEAR